MNNKAPPIVAEDLSVIPDTIRYGLENHHVQVASSREFLLTNGNRFCSSSCAGNTRRYHGLLIDTDQLILSSLHEIINGISLLPGWWGEQSPEETLGHVLHTSLYPVIQEIAVDDVLITKMILLDRGLTIRWDINGTADLTIRPLMNCRNIKDLNPEPLARIRPVSDGFISSGYHFRCTFPFTEDNQVYYHARYPEDAARGYDATENLVSPGQFTGIITNDSASLSIYPFDEPGPLLASDPVTSPDLLFRASDICIRGGDILAGYPWFVQSWGRDTFISLPGLLLSFGRYHEAESIFRTFLRHRKGGFIPNRIPDSYHSSDATLWLFWALFQYLQTHHDSPFIDEISHDLEELIFSYPESEVTGMEHDLISTAPCSTWMDTLHTPREGKPVEVNALWILALEVCDYLEIGVPVSPKNVRRSFYTFWNEENGCLYDVVDPLDTQIRPNQLIALALGLMPFDEGRLALERIRSDLLTPYGLRTLAPGSEGYYGSYAGDPSYHNGMVWPWLIAWYVDALLQYGETPYHASRLILPLWHYLFTDGAGMLPEFFEGEPPYRPGGTFCQAWSIGEFIRARNTVLSARMPSK